MATKKTLKPKTKSVKIEEGLFFPSDFKQLPENTIIFIKSGKLILVEDKREKK